VLAEGMVALIDQDSVLFIRDVVELVQRIIFIGKPSQQQFVPDQFLKIIFSFLEKDL
jgi:hypothetical protein